VTFVKSSQARKKATALRSQLSDAQWREAIAIIGIPGAELVREKPTDPNGRVYRHGRHIYKLYLHIGRPRDAAKRQHLVNEYEAARRCRGIAAVPEMLRYDRLGHVEFTIQRAVDGESLKDRRIGWQRIIIATWALAIVLARLSWRGIAHNDLNLGNVLMTVDGRFYLIDFDKADIGSRGRAVYRNYFREHRSGERYGGALLDLVWKMVYVETGRIYLRCDRCIELGHDRLRHHRYQFAMHFARRALVMRPWRMAAWRLLTAACRDAVLRR